ncbi:MAG: hypothetical protein KKC75_07155 [Nanoarchaeota archaeon]|nr:hypothetical protein [Nanoarchaeota archaeon]MBU1005466.1 hypothetical protein [Nanoarchaeota archaeon]
MDLTQYDIEIKRHAFIRAMERNVSPDMIEATIKGGKVERFGKHGIKLIKEYKRFTVICVGQMVGTKIKIFTIETKGG